MCGRFLSVSDSDLYDELSSICERIEYDIENQCNFSKEIFPKDKSIVISFAKTKIMLQNMTWGFAANNGKSRSINACAETVVDIPLFKESFAKNRCVIPAAGYFEWSKINYVSPKDKYLLKRKNEKILFFAGIKKIIELDNKSTYDAFVILTKAADKSISEIHSRMPVVLDREELKLWCDDLDYATNCILKGMDDKDMETINMSNKPHQNSLW